MPGKRKPLSMDAFALRIGIAGFGAVFAAALVLGMLVTPADRGGGPILERYVRPAFEALGLWPENRELKGKNPLALQDIRKIEQVRFLVRFENLPAAEASLRMFRENRSAGRKAFREWALTTDTFREFELAALTPSGEAVLVFQPGMEVKASRQELARLEKLLNNEKGVAYADPYPFLPAAVS